MKRFVGLLVGAVCFLSSFAQANAALVTVNFNVTNGVNTLATGSFSFNDALAGDLTNIAVGDLLSFSLSGDLDGAGAQAPFSFSSISSFTSKGFSYNYTTNLLNPVNNFGIKDVTNGTRFMFGTNSGNDGFRIGRFTGTLGLDDPTIYVPFSGGGGGGSSSFTGLSLTPSTPFGGGGGGGGGGPSAVPEPTSMALLGLLGAVGGIGYFRRRKAVKAE